MIMTREKLKINGNRSDHDLLIILDTKVDSLITDIKELKDGTTAKLIELDARLGVVELDHQKIGGVDSAFKKLEKVETKVHDFELRWKTLIALASAVGAVVGFIIDFVAIRAGFFK